MIKIKIFSRRNFPLKFYFSSMCFVQEHSATCRAEDKQRVRAELEKFRGDTWLNVAGKKFKVRLRTGSLISSAHEWELRGLV
jgi:hypothetical protein